MGGFENFPDLVADLERAGEVLGNAPDTLRAVRDPEQLRKAVQASGMRMPQMLPPGTQPDPALRWLRKRRQSGGGFGIEAWTGEVPADPEVLVQRWVDGEPGSISFVADGHMAHTFAMTRQLSGDPAFGAAGFVYVGTLLIAQPNAALFARLEHLATVVTRSFGLVGLNGIDFIVQGEDVTVLEVNPRFSASMELVEEALGVSLFGWHVAGCQRLPIADFPARQDQRVFGKATVFARRDGRFPDTSDWPAQGWRDVVRTGELLRAGLPMCLVMAEGMDEAECYAQLVAQAQAVWNRV
jgi:predicted ATP-grasp superfamily ATP-dependent carboligase